MTGRPPIYVSTACLPGPVPLADRLAAYRDHGLNAVELGAGVVPEPNWLEVARQHEGPLLLHNYFPPPEEPFALNLASSDPDIASRSENLVQTALLHCHELGAPFYSVHGGFITDPVISDTDFTFPAPESPHAADKARTRFTHQVEHFAALASENNLGLLLENNVCKAALKGKLLNQTPEECGELFEAVPCNNIGLLLDTGHLKVSARTLLYSRDAFIDRLQPYIRAFHLHTNDGLEDQHRPVEPESWEIELLLQEGFASVPVIVEASFPDVVQLANHVHWLRETLGCT